MAQDIMNQIHKALIKNKKTIAVAESCTGGLLSNLLTRVSGSSEYFILGMVAYSNAAKKNILKIPNAVLIKYGAVSENTARLMAQRIKKIAKVDLGIGITGIAGPRGATLHKPVGTVFIAIEGKDRKICKKFHFAEKRAGVRKKTALTALKLLKFMITYRA